MKTISELSVKTGIDRSTLLKAAQQSRIPARQSGATWLIDDESEEFKQWVLVGSHMGRPRKFPETIVVESPDPPAWVNTAAGRHMWHSNLGWQCDAARATENMAQSGAYRRHLLKEADRIFNQ